jgi:hypothetical protein
VVSRATEIYANDDAHPLDIERRHSREIQTVAEIIDSRKIDRSRHGESNQFK